MSLMGFLTGAASLFGNKDGKSSNQTQNSVTNSKSEQAATANETKTGTTNQTSSSTGTSTTSGSTSQTGTTKGTESSVTTGATSNYSADILAGLDQLVKSQLGLGNTASAALTDRLTQLQTAAAQPAFDVAGYAKGITDAAAASTQNQLDSQINSILSATGSSEGGNSMAALLGAKLRGEAAANLAGINANAVATGQQIADQQQASLTQQISGLSGDISTQLTNLLAAAKGGTQTTTGTSTGTSSQTSSQTGTTSSTTKESAQTNLQQTEKSSTDQIGITQNVGSSTTKSSGKTSTDSGDLFTKILEQFSKSSAAA